MCITPPLPPADATELERSLDHDVHFHHRSGRGYAAPETVFDLVLLSEHCMAVLCGTDTLIMAFYSNYICTVGAPYSIVIKTTVWHY